MSRTQVVLIRRGSAVTQHESADLPLPVPCCLSSFDPAEGPWQRRGAKQAGAWKILEGCMRHALSNPWLAA